MRDLADTDVHAFHRFLWSHHLGYAHYYEVGLRFGVQNIRASRVMFFSDLRDQVARMDAWDTRGVASVFEVGCSLGYQLRFIETDVFPTARELRGIDVDSYAIECGLKYLREVGSRVTIECGDMSELERLLGGKKYDLMVCTGVLMYLNEAAAAQVVATMLQHGRLVALAGLAHPRIDNALLRHSDVRTSDKSFIHNLDRMVVDRGGHVAWRRWEGDRDFDGNTVYFVFATEK